MNIVIYLDNKGVYDYPFSEKRYIESYSDLCFELKRNNVNPYIARGPDSYLGAGLFSEVYVFNENRELVPKGRIQADLIFDKGDKSTFPDDKFKKINSIEIDKICNDKAKTYELFGNLSPWSIKVNDYEELKNELQNINVDKLVFKPVEGFGGEGIVIASKEEILIQIHNNEDVFPGVVQEFIDTSNGIPGITDTHHDLRAIVINGEIVQASLRTPPQGSLIANIKKGGSIKAINIDLLSKEIVDAVARVDSKLSAFGNRIYAVDFVYNGSKYYLLELNSRPGWHPISEGESAKTFIVKLAKLLVASG